MNETIRLIQNHRSIRKYKSKDIEEEKLIEIIKSAQSASTSNFIQAYSIISIEDKEKRRAIAELSGKQSYIEECPVFLVFCADFSRIEKACADNGAVFEGGYTEGLIIATVDAALAAQNAMIAAESLGLGGVYIGGIRNNPEKIAEIIALPKNSYPLVGMCLGYPEEITEVKERLPLPVVYKKNQYKCDEDEKLLKEYNERIKNYYTMRTEGKRQDTWSSQVANLMSKPQRPHMKKFLEDRGFMLK